MRATLPLADIAVCDDNGKHVDVYRIRFWESLNLLREEIMRKSLAIFVFLIAGVFLWENACALETFIPHVTYGSPDWDDYFQANNNTPSDASFTLTLYGGGAQVYSGVHTVPALDHLLIDLKSLSPDAETGMVEYQEPGLNFRVSYENDGGGVAEFKTIDRLESGIGLYFSDFTASVVFKGAAVANLGESVVDVTLYAVGDGAVQGEFSTIIEPKEKIVGIHTAWFPQVDFSEVDSVVAAATSQSLCGIVISSDIDLSHLLFTPAPPVSMDQGDTVGCGDVLNGVVETSTDTDEYQFTAKAGERVSISLENQSVSANFRPCWTLYDPSGNRIGNSQYCETREIFTLPDDGAYSIKVMDDNQNGTGEYDLYLKPVSAYFNGMVNCATPMQCGETVDGDLASKLAIDSYRFSAKAGEAVTVVIENNGVSANFDPCFTLYDASGERVGNSQYCETSQLFYLPDDAIYTLGVKDDNFNGYDSYSIRVEPVSALFNGEASCASPVSFGTPVTGATESLHASDSYAFAGTAGRQVQIGIVNNSASALFSACFTLYDQTGQRIGNSQYCETTQAFTLPGNEQYTIRVHDNDGDGTGEYGLSLDAL